MVRRALALVVGIAVLGCLAAAAAASDGGAVARATPAPSVTQFSPPGQSLTYGANPSRTGQARDARVFGPMGRAWSRRLPEIVSTPLVTKGRVLVNASLPNGDYGSRILALNPHNGRTVWQRSFGGSYFTAHIGAAGNTVVAVNYDGVVRAFSIKTGRPLWETGKFGGANSSGPLVTPEAVYFWRDGAVTALSTKDGHILWQTYVGASTIAADPSMDSARIFVGDDCGSATAISRASGDIVWQRTIPTGHTCFAQGTIVAAGRVYSGRGFVFDARTGHQLGRIPLGSPGAVAGDTAFGYSRGYAYDMPAGKRRWGSRAGSALRPLIGSGTIYYARAQSIAGLDVATGKQLSNIRTGYRDSGGPGGGRPGLAIGGGMLLIADGDTVRAYRPFMHPSPRAAFLLSYARSVTAGRRAKVMIGLGSKIRSRGKKLTLRARPYTSRNVHKVASAHARSDGTAVFHPRISRNTVLIADAKGAKLRGAFGVIAFPHYRVRAHPTSRTRGVIETSIKRVPGKVLGGRRVFGYIARAKTTTMHRLGSARLRRTGRKSAKGKIRFKLLQHAGARDFVFVCVRGLSKAGWGPLDNVQRHCGAKKLNYGGRGRQAASHALGGRASISTGDRPAIGAGPGGPTAPARIASP